MDIRQNKNPSSWLNKTVVGTGITSALGDFAYETATVILPGFLAVLGIPAFALGAIEGVADAISSFTKLGAGFLSDRVGRRKPLVMLGYGLTAIAQALFAIATGWGLILFGRTVAWFGRGVRGPLRDAILAEAITSQTRGRAFGFHRAADTVGAVIGPLLGVALLAMFQNASSADASVPFRNVFWLTLIPGTLSVLSFGFFVNEKPRDKNPRLKFWKSIRSLPVNFRHYLTAVGVFGMGDFAHTLLILAATQLLTADLSVVKAAQVAGLLYVGRNVVQAVVSYPVGHLADKYGHKKILTIGYIIAVLTALMMAFAFLFQITNIIYLAFIFFLAGVYIAVEDALESTMTAEYVPQELRGTGYGLLGTVNGIGDLISSSVVGLLWTVISPVAGFGFAAILMLTGTLMMLFFKNRK